MFLVFHFCSAKFKLVSESNEADISDGMYEWGSDDRSRSSETESTDVSEVEGLLSLLVLK